MTVSTATNGRLPTGQFAPGNRASAGRTSRATELRKAFVAAVSAEDVAAIAQKLVELAKAGDVPCAKLILDRLGRPGTDDDEIDTGRNRVLAILHPSAEATDVD